jgi:hypothetical protein
MEKYIYLILLFSADKIFCQDFQFKWKITPSFSDSYNVTITRIGSNRAIKITSSISKDTTTRRLGKNKCNKLIEYLSHYQFKFIGRESNGPIHRNYTDTKFMSDTLWVMIDEKKYWKSLLDVYGYYFDKDSNKYFSETITQSYCLDGTDYDGELIIGKEKKRFSVACSGVTLGDYNLNIMIYRSIQKYFRKSYMTKLKYAIESDKPRINK